mgnify:FL=1
MPPGQPWPSSPEGYQNFSQVGNSPNLVNRIQETSSTSTTTKSPQETISLGEHSLEHTEVKQIELF